MRTGCGGRDRRHDRRLADGGYSVVEATIVMPVVILLCMFVVQWALVWHGRHVAEAAAQSGLRTARGYEATAADGQDAAERYIAAVAPNLLSSPAVRVTRTQNEAAVHVRARVLAVVPGLPIDVDETATGPVERFVP